MERTFTKQDLIATSLKPSVPIYGRNNYQAASIATSLKLSVLIYIWKERLPSEPQSRLPQHLQSLYMARTITKQVSITAPHRSFPLINKYGKNDYQAKVQSQLPQIFRSSYMARTITEQVSIAASSKFSSHTWCGKERLLGSLNCSFF